MSIPRVTRAAAKKQARNMAILKKLPQEVVDLICRHLPSPWRGPNSKYTTLHSKNCADPSPSDFQNARFVNRQFDIAAAGRLFSVVRSDGPLYIHERLLELSKSRLAPLVRNLHLDIGLLYKDSVDVFARNAESHAELTEYAQALGRFINLSAVSLTYSHESSIIPNPALSTFLAALGHVRFEKLRELQVDDFCIMQSLNDQIPEMRYNATGMRILGANLANIQVVTIAHRYVKTTPTPAGFTALPMHFPGLTTLSCIRLDLFEPSNRVVMNHLTTLWLENTKIAPHHFNAMIKPCKTSLVKLWIQNSVSVSDTWGSVLKYIAKECKYVVDFVFNRNRQPWKGPEQGYHDIYTGYGEWFGCNELTAEDIEALQNLGKRLDRNRLAVKLAPQYHPMRPYDEHKEFCREQGIVVMQVDDEDDENDMDFLEVSGPANYDALEYDLGYEDGPDDDEETDVDQEMTMEEGEGISWRVCDMDDVLRRYPGFIRPLE